MTSLTKLTFCKALQGTCSIIALIMRVGEGVFVAERAAGKLLHDKAHVDSSTHPNSPYGTRSKVAPSSTPNPSTLQQSLSSTSKAVKRWSPPSPSMPTVRSNSSADDSPTTATRGEWTSVRETGDLHASGSSGKTAKVSLCLHQKSLRHCDPRRIKPQSYHVPYLAGLP